MAVFFSRPPSRKAYFAAKDGGFILDCFRSLTRWSFPDRRAEKLFKLEKHLEATAFKIVKRSNVKFL